MRIEIAAVGRLKEGPERELAARYDGMATALGRRLKIGPIAISELAESRKPSEIGRAHV